MEFARRVFRPFLGRVERLVDALTDPARRERTALAVLAAYAAIWTLYGVLSKAAQGVQSDTAELVDWSHHLAPGYAKHLPFAAWLMHTWFMLFPTRDWSCYLLAMVYAALGLWIAWRLFARFLDPDKRVVALACLTLVPYFNFLGLRFDHNAVLGALWAATALCFIRSYETRSATWAAAAGAAAAAAMLGKYWSIMLLAGLAVAAIVDTRRAIYFRSAAPWVTIAVGALLLAPHGVWLVTHDFMPITYALDAHSAKNVRTDDGQRRELSRGRHRLRGGAGDFGSCLDPAERRGLGRYAAAAHARAAVRCGCIPGDAGDSGRFRARLQIRSQSDMDHVGFRAAAGAPAVIAGDRIEPACRRSDRHIRRRIAAGHAGGGAGHRAGGPSPRRRSAAGACGACWLAKSSNCGGEPPTARSA
jgi:4-amino-4-deoxy-L-arabinose transferase-like glycosyltransferase